MRYQTQRKEKMVITTNIPQKREPFDCIEGGTNEAHSSDKYDLEWRDK